MKIIKMIISAVLCVALMGITITSAQVEFFTDVDDSFWGYDAIQWGVENNIATGYEDGTFKPNKNVTEEEFVALLVRAFGITTSDKEDQHWSEPYYKVAYEHNLPVSYTGGAVEINRQAVAEIIVATRGANFSGDDAILYLLNKGLANGKTSSTIEGYKGLDTLSRAEAITFIKNVLDKTTDRTMKARPSQMSPNFLIAHSEELQITNPNEIENLEQTIRMFNEELQRVGLESSYLLNFINLSLNENLNSSNSDVRVYTVHNYEITSQAYKDYYTLSISMNIEAGEVDKVAVLVPNGEKLKEITQSVTTALIQNIEVSKQFYEKHKLSSIIDNAPNGRYSSNTSVADGQYEATYHLMKSFEKKEEGEDDDKLGLVFHIFEIKRL